MIGLRHLEQSSPPRTLKGCLHGGRKILEGETTFHLVNMQTFWSEWLPRGEGKEKNCRPLDAERLAAAILFFFVPSTT